MTEFNPRYISYDETRAEAEEFLNEYHTPLTIPVPIEEIVEFDLSMEIIPMLGLRDEITGEAFLSSDLEAIYVDEETMRYNPGRYRFSLAHEIAHYWLHDELYQNTKVDNIRDWRAVQEALGAGYRNFETQANNFAGLVLVPTDELTIEFRTKATQLAGLGFHGDALSREPARSRIITHMAQHFNVSDQTAAIRLERENLLLSVDQLKG